MIRVSESRTERWRGVPSLSAWDENQEAPVKSLLDCRMKEDSVDGGEELVACARTKGR
jgi:hypothetical protein